MRIWALILGGLAVWAAHFFVLYGIASVLPGQPLAHWLVVLVTLPAAAAAALILWRALARMNDGDRLYRTAALMGAVGAGIALVGILWQAAPALLL